MAREISEGLVIVISISNAGDMHSVIIKRSHIKGALKWVVIEAQDLDANASRLEPARQLSSVCFDPSDARPPASRDQPYSFQRRAQACTASPTALGRADSSSESSGATDECKTEGGSP